MPSPSRLYQFQKNVAYQRAIPWEFTYEIWLAWWEQQLGPNWPKYRGRKAGQYVMARIGDQGAYNPQNVRCILHTENTKEAAPRMTKAYRLQRGAKPFVRRRTTLKLTKEQVLAIRAMQGTSAAIARQFGVSASFISRIRHSKRRI